MAEDFELEEDRFKKLVANPKFQTRILNLRKRYGIPKDGFKDNKSEELKKDEYSDATLRELNSDLYKIVDAFKLSTRWYEGLRIYLFKNNPFMFRVQSSNVLDFKDEDIISWENQRPKTIRTMWIRVDAETTEDEVIEALKAAKDHLPKSSIYRPAYNASKVIRGRQLRQGGLSWEDVADEVNREFRSGYDKDSIRKAVERLNKQS